MSFNWKPLPVVCTQAAEIHHILKPQLCLGPKQAPFLQPAVSEVSSTSYACSENCNIIHFTVTLRTNSPRLNSKKQLWTVNHTKRELTCSAEQRCLVCVTFCRRCKAQLASPRSIMQLIREKACYSCDRNEYLRQFLQDLIIRVSWGPCTTRIVTWSLQNAMQGKRKRGNDSCMGRDAFEQNAQSMKHSQKVKDALKATATESHFVANNDLNEDWTPVLHSEMQVVFFVHLSKICCILGWSCGVLIFLPRLVKWVWVLRTYLFKAVTSASELGRNLTCILKHIWCQNCCTLVVFLCRKLSCLGYKNPCGPIGILQGSKIFSNSIAGRNLT